MEYNKVDDTKGKKVDENMECKKVDDDSDWVKIDVDDFIPFLEVLTKRSERKIKDIVKDTGDQSGTMKFDKVDNMECKKVDSDMEWEKIDENVECKKVGNDMDCEKVDDDYLTLLPPVLKWRAEKEIKDIVKDVALPFLPAKVLAKFMSVSKEWDKWIKSPLLAHLQSHCFKDLSGFYCQYAEEYPIFVTLDNNAYGVRTPSLNFLPELVNILSSCNGLLLCRGREELDLYYVCNPATQNWINLPRPELYHGTNSEAILAFEPSALNMGAHYHVICAISMFDHILFELYSSETKSWKIMDTIPVGMEVSGLRGNGFYMKGVAFWETSARKVIAFHLSTEVFEIISLPYATPEDGVLTQMQGELCYIGISPLVGNQYTIKIYTGMDLKLKQRVSIKLGPESNSLPLYRVLPCLDGNYNDPPGE